MTLQPIVPARPRPARCAELILTWQFLIDASPTVRAELGRGITDATHTATEAVGSREAGDGVLTVVGEAKSRVGGARPISRHRTSPAVWHRSGGCRQAGEGVSRAERTLRDGGDRLLPWRDRLR